MKVTHSDFHYEYEGKFTVHKPVETDDYGTRTDIYKVPYDHGYEDGSFYADFKWDEYEFETTRPGGEDNGELPDDVKQAIKDNKHEAS